MSITENYDEFKKWWKGFNGSDYQRGTQPKKEWFDNCQKNHQDIRKYLGGMTLEFDVDLPERPAKVPYDNIKTYVERLAHTIPDLKKHLEKDLTKLCEPYLLIGTRKIATTKVLTRWLNESKVVGYEQEDGAYYISLLGQEYQRNKIIALKCKAYIDTSVQGFLKLGHYDEADAGSCFEQGCDNDVCKFTIAQTPDTFVLRFDKGGKTISRCWGFATDKYKTFNLTNWYCENENHFSTFEEAALCVIKTQLGDKAEFLPENTKIPRDVDPGPVYLNGDWRHISTAKSPSANLKWEEYDQEDIYCDGCNQVVDEATYELAEGGLICESCKEDANFCELTEKLTFSDVVPYYRTRGDCIKISADIGFDRNLNACDCGAFMDKGRISGHSEYNMTPQCEECTGIPYKKKKLVKA